MKLLLTRPLEQSKTLATALVGDGHSVICSPLLDIEFKEIPDFGLEGVTAIAFTSANGVRAFAGLTDNRSHPSYCVGDKTARVAKAAGFEKVVSANGDVSDLARLIIKSEKPAQGVLLHAGGARLAGDLKADLEAAGFSYRREILYEAKNAETLSEDALNSVKAGTLDGILLFSPHTAKVFKALVDSAGLASHIQKIDAWCLSENVARELKGVGFANLHVAGEPTETQLLATIRGQVPAKSSNTVKHPIDPGEQDVSDTPEKNSGKKTETTGQSKSSGAASASQGKTAKAATVPVSTTKKAGNNFTKIAAGLLIAFSAGMATWPIILPTVAPILPDSARAILQGTNGSEEVIQQQAEKISELDAKLAELSSRHSALASKASEVTSSDLTALKSEIALLKAEETTGPGETLVQFDTLQKEIASLREKLRSYDEQIAGLSVQTVTPASGSGAIDDGQLRAVSSQLAALKAALAEITRQQSVSTDEIGAQKQMLATMEEAIKLQATSAESSTDNASKSLILLAISQVQRDSRLDQPFASSLKQVQAVATEDMQPDLLALETVAQSGAATFQDLTRQYSVVAIDITQAARLPESESWYGKTLHNLATLVKFRKVGDTESDTVDAKVAKAEVMLSEGDLAGAVSVLQGLEGDSLKAASDWLAAAKSRVLVEQTIASLLEKAGSSALKQQAAEK